MEEGLTTNKSLNTKLLAILDRVGRTFLVKQSKQLRLCKAMIYMASSGSKEGHVLIRYI